jgi:broad specificity phosphatase PhoE
LSRRFTPPLPIPSQLSIWRQAAELAAEYWRRASEDSRISPGMRSETARAAETVRAALERLG